MKTECSSAAFHGELLLLALLAGSCSSREKPGGKSEVPPGGSAVPSPDSSSTQPDSVALERSACFGSCPVYRLVLYPSDEARFESVGEGGRTAQGVMKPGAFSRVVTSMLALGFATLPDTITRPAVSGPCHTDAPTATVLLYLKGGVKGMADYLGCSLAQPELRALEREMDRAAGVDRWID